MTLARQQSQMVDLPTQVHAVGLYGPHGAGVAEHLDYDAQKAAGNSPDPVPGSVMDRVDIITGPIHSCHLECMLMTLHRHSR